MRPPAFLGLVGAVYMLLAVFNERRMHRHRQPGVTYAQATFRRDGGWRRTDLFTPDGLGFQQKAARYGVVGTALWIAALIWLALG